MNIQELIEKYQEETPQGNVQSFIDGLEAREDEVVSLFYIINDILDTLTNREESVKEWIKERLEEHKSIFDNESESLL